MLLFSGEDDVNKLSEGKATVVVVVVVVVAPAVVPDGVRVGRVDGGGVGGFVGVNFAVVV